MRQGNYQSALQGMGADRNAWRWLAIGLLAGDLLLGVALMMKSERTVVTPPEIHKTFWVSDDHASPEYLEQMALWFAGLVLNISPANVEYQNELFLRYATPDGHGRMKSLMAVQAKRIKRLNASQVFYLNRYKIDPDHMQVALSGQLKKWVGEEPLPVEDKTFRARFRMEGGRMLVSEFKEAKWDDPFNAKSDPDTFDADGLSR